MTSCINHTAHSVQLLAGDLAQPAALATNPGPTAQEDPTEAPSVIVLERVLTLLRTTTW